MAVPEFAARPQLAEDVARYVRRRIFDGTYAAGEYVRLDQLAVELGVSVTPVREALFQLRAEGLLVQQPRRGFMVLPVTERDLPAIAHVQAPVGAALAARAEQNIRTNWKRPIPATTRTGRSGSTTSSTARSTWPPTHPNWPR